MKNTNEDGIALIAVLSILTIILILAASIVAVSQTQRLRSATLTQNAFAVYSGESAANTAIWKIISDRKKYPDRTLGGNIELNDERFQANGRIHEFESNNRQYKLQICDLYSGLNLSSAASEQAFNFLHQYYISRPEQLNKLGILRNRLADYVDSDDLIRINSIESADYRALKLSPLPRNNEIQYREELLWIPDGSEFIMPDENGILSMINLITPERGYSLSVQPNLFSAPLELIKLKCNYSESDLLAVAEALTQIKQNGLTLDSAFVRYPNLLTKLKQEFSITESGLYTIIVTPAAGGRSTIISLPIGNALPTEKIKFLQYRIL